MSNYLHVFGCCNKFLFSVYLSKSLFFKIRSIFAVPRAINAILPLCPICTGLWEVSLRLLSFSLRTDSSQHPALIVLPPLLVQGASNRYTPSHMQIQQYFSLILAERSSLPIQSSRQQHNTRSSQSPRR